ncbi:MAG: hypothetical protein WA738_04415 [Candidatus Angelobacter sp.]
MRRNGYVSTVWVVFLAAAIVGCGSGSTTSPNVAPLTGIKKRVLLSNQQVNSVNLLDANRDTVSSKNFTVPGPTKLVTAGGKTLAMSTGQNSVTVIDSATEVVTFNITLVDLPSDIAITPDGKFGWVAERATGGVQFVGTADGSASPSPISVPNARRVVMSPNGTKVLIFSDPQAQVPPNTNTFFVIDTTSKVLTTITSSHLDQPITAVFGASDTQAFILNCGAQCGGTAASVVSVDFSSATPAFSANVAVPAATVGLLNAGNLYVAGTPAPALTGPGPACPLSRCGVLTVINTGSLTAGTSTPITDGLHEKMALANGRLYIGSSGCSVDPGTAPNTVRGCLTIFNTVTPGTKFPAESSFRQNFDVTGFQPISSRSVIYVVQGGEIDIFDTTTDALATGITQLDVVGKAVDVVQIDP